ncbi:DUF2799 domain-containing protein [Vibrio sinaloensis]|uniref:DUF2799 domain-containing protein n=1 Tax=Photobacterium sp. (strain ATCC 43367) TaxID=379097 RepID=UPI0020671BC7|nr:DUF2799 domain-containing protein [Vibrio sinaloensis]UPQ87534.1 DUF2799 domain-containing protein [Vibrio sinaloensis]
MRKFYIAVLAALLAACTSSPQQLANEGDWYQIGYQDGIVGHTPRTSKALASLGSAKQSDYDQGYLEGIGEYCNPDFAYQMGLSGQYYQGVCEGTDEAQKFRMEWQRGWSEYQN